MVESVAMALLKQEMAGLRIDVAAQRSDLSAHQRDCLTETRLTRSAVEMVTGKVETLSSDVKDAAADVKAMRADQVSDAKKARERQGDQLRMWAILIIGSVLSTGGAAIISTLNAHNNTVHEIHSTAETAVARVGQ